MRTAYSLLILGILCILSPGLVVAQVECSGSLKQEKFFKEIKQLNVKIQDNILEGRKLEAELAGQTKGSAETAPKEKRLAEIKAELQEQKKTFNVLNAPNFPPTPLTALGAACGDFRWVDRAKEVLIKNPEKLGQHYFVWMDKGNREVRASQDRPKLEFVAK